MKQKIEIETRDAGWIIRRSGVEWFGRYYGLYRGIVRVRDGKFYLEVPDLGIGELPFEARYSFLAFGSEENDSGLIFEPQDGDEVWVAFEYGVVEKPVIVGYRAEKRRDFKFGLRTRKGDEFIYSEENQVLTINSSNGKLKIAIDFQSGDIDLMTDGVVRLVSDDIRFGDENPSERGVLGDQLVELLNEIFDWLKTHTHAQASPPAQIGKLEKIKNGAKKILSKVVRLK